MHRMKSLLILATLAVIGAGCAPEPPCAACPFAGPDKFPVPGPKDAGGRDAGSVVPDAGDVASDAGLPDAGGDAGTSAQFLDESAYADLITIAANFPFGVTKRYEAEKSVLGSHWGHHGGPMVTVGNFGGKRSTTRAVLQWAIGTEPTGTATFTPRILTVASDLPKTHFYGIDGMVDLPFGDLALLSYTSTGSTFPGEVLLYSQTYDAVVSRGKANGFYSGAGVVVGETSLLVYSGLSPVAAATSSTVKNGLYAAPICNKMLLAEPPCPAVWQLFGWEGSSGPVVTDSQGNVFVAASLSSGAKSDAVYGLAKSQLAIGATPKATTIVEVDSMGTFTLAALAPVGTQAGWVVGLGFVPPEVIYAAGYTVSDAGLAASGQFIPAAITPVSGASTSVFSDDDGALWLAVVKGSKGTYLKLERRSP